MTPIPKVIKRLIIDIKLNCFYPSLDLNSSYVFQTCNVFLMYLNHGHVYFQSV